MAILQAFQGTPQGNAAAVAATMMSDIKRDGADQGDVKRNAANVVIAQADDPILFTQYMFQQHPEMEEEFEAFIEDNNLVVNSQDDFVDAIKLYLTNKRRYEMFAQGGQFETNQNTIEVQIGDKVYRLLVAETEEEKERGLMNVVEMDPDEGMLFDYSDDPQASISF